ncbi:hypothetical protein ACPV4H_02315 [Vibrio rotiferianus]|uniref:hypothetical protein n=1 Tax=Vibrio rotiferianus TaxID=190895 RepID=UPI00406A74E1
MGFVDKFKIKSRNRNIMKEKSTYVLLWFVLVYCFLGAVISNNLLGFSHFLSLAWVGGVGVALTLISVFALGMGIMKGSGKPKKRTVANIGFALFACCLCIIYAPFGENISVCASIFSAIVSIASLFLAAWSSSWSWNNYSVGDKYATYISIYTFMFFLISLTPWLKNT